MNKIFEEMDKVVNDFFKTIDEMIKHDDDIDADGVSDIVDKVNKKYGQ